MHDQYDGRSRSERLAEIVEYTRRDLSRRDAVDGAVHIHYHEAARPEPPPPPAPDIATKYAGHFVLLLGGCLILSLITIAMAVLIPMIIGMLMSLAITAGMCAVSIIAVVVAIRSLRQSGAEQEINREVVQDLRDARPKRKRR